MGAEEEFTLGDIFPLREDVPVDDNMELSPEEHALMAEISREEEITTSYLLVNTLLNLLISKGIIQQSEVNELLSELHKNYIQKKRQ